MMENLHQRKTDRRVVWIHRHQWCHGIPPFAYDWKIGQLIGAVALGEFLDGKQSQSFLIEKNRIIGNSGLRKRLGKLRPDLIVAFPVFLLVSGKEFHFEGASFHEVDNWFPENTAAVDIPFQGNPDLTPCAKR